MAIEHKAWLDLIKEDPILPQISIIDPHHHLWDYPENRYLMDELLEDTSGGHHIVKTVFVECLSMYRKEGPAPMQPVGETDFVCDVAAKGAGDKSGSTSVAAGIVGFADLSLGPAVLPVLEAHSTAAGGCFRGIRHANAWDAAEKVRNAHTNPPKSLLLDPTFRQGFACLKKYDLSFDAWLYHPQMGELADLATAFPETRIILDHVGGPLGIGPFDGKRDAVFEDWKRGIVALAACENVVVKLGGLGMPICGLGFHRRAKPPTSVELAEATKPYYLFCIEQFGVKRCMFESNFPVDKLSCSYTVLWNSFKRITSGFSDDERADLFHNTAAKVYRL